jgi:hypothetical protein
MDDQIESATLRFYFHLASTSCNILDFEGVEVQSLEVARRGALEAIEEFFAAESTLEADLTGWEVLIVDEAGHRLSAFQLGCAS